MFKRSNPARKQAGFTLVETCVAVATSAALLGQAIPAFQQMLAQQRLKVEVQSVGEDLRWARAEALTSGQSVFMSFGSKDATQCYVIHTGKGGDCTCTTEGQTQCKGEGVALRTHWMPSKSGISFRSNAPTLNFQPERGLVSSTASVEIRHAKGTSVKQIIAITGRVRSCTASGQLSGLKACA